jgi:hypothetical protein
MHTLLVLFCTWIYTARREQQYQVCGRPTGKNYQPAKQHQKEATSALACHSWSFPDDGGGHYRGMSNSMNNF